jgi:uncharacterized membrane protein
MTMQPGGSSVPKAAYAALLGLVVAAFVGMRLWNLAAVCLDDDEVFSLLAARHDVAGLWAHAGDDISHPPLFYLMLKGWMLAGGESLLWLRLLPALLSFSALVPFLLLCRERRVGPLATALALFLWAANGLLIYYAQHLRNFILLQALSLWSLWFLARWAGREGNRRGDLLGLFVVNLLAVYAHYWGWVLVGTEFLILLAVARRRCVLFVLVSILILVAYAPWVYTVVQSARAKGTAVAQIDWIRKPTVESVVWFVATMNGTHDFARNVLLGLALFGAPVLLWFVAAVRGRSGEGPDRTAHLVALLLLAALPALVTFVASHVLSQSVWATRQLLYSVVPYLLLVAIAVARLRHPVARRGLALALCAWAAVAGVRAIRTECVKVPYDRLFAELVAREVADGGEGEVVVYADEGFFLHVAKLHLTERWGSRFRHVEVGSFDEVRGDRFWVIHRQTGWKEDPPPQEALERMGYRCGEESSVGAAMRVAVFPAQR